ncbi:MAG TPA: MATE family efflux transporter [Tepiditoga sp.]|nr:MATE family efflux transporter [Tepiditoga sp.]
MDNKKNILDTEHVGNLLFKLAFPATVAMMVQALYNFVDTIFIGRGVGTLGIAAISIAFPFQMIIMAISQMIGIGGGSIISRRIGEKNIASAEKVMGNIFSTVILFGILFAVLGNIFMDNLLILFGSTPEIFQYAKDYLSIIVYSNIFFGFAMASNNVIRAQGHAKIAMISMLISGISNIFLDPVFIFDKIDLKLFTIPGLNLGIAGAAYATVLSQVIGVIYITAFILSGKSFLKFHIKNLKPDFKVIKETFAIGSAAFVRQVSGSVLTIILNNLLKNYGDSSSIAIYGVINRLTMFALMPLFGISQGFLPIAGFNYGAKRYNMVKKSLFITGITASVFSTVGFVLLEIFPKQLISIFSPDTQLINDGSVAVRIVVAVLFLVGFQVVGSSLFQAIGKAAPSLLLSMSRQILFLIPLLFIFSGLFGLIGIWIAFPIADFLSSLLTGFFVFSEIKILNRQHKESVPKNISEIKESV